MNYFDPARPKLPNDRPMYMNASGKGIAALRFPYVDLAQDETGKTIARLSLFLMRGSYATDFHVEISFWELDQFWKRFLDDPEAVMLADFGYSPPETAEGPSLEDLGPAVQKAGTTAGDMGL